MITVRPLLYHLFSFNPVTKTSVFLRATDEGKATRLHEGRVIFCLCYQKKRT
jgi:hypothetical protein